MNLKLFRQKDFWILDIYSYMVAYHPLFLAIDGFYIYILKNWLSRQHIQVVRSNEC